MRETWSPAPRELFSNHEREATEASKASRYLIETLESFRVQSRPNAELGAELGKAFVRVYEAGSEHFKPDQFRIMHRYIAEILGPQDGPAFISGFMSELTAATIFQELDLPTYYPLKEEDLYLGVDWWVDLSDIGSGAAPIQVKALPLRSDVPNQVLYPLRNEGAIYDMLDYLIVPKNFDISERYRDENIDRYRDKLGRSAFKLLSTRQRYQNAVPTMMIIQSPTIEPDRPHTSDCPCHNTALKGQVLQSIRSTGS